ncbi:MAG: cyclic peptide export ABC transporter [Anaerolineales bacterium]|nr:cyclic peptide export ABC transporter [Anaerolineales bacterium]
MRLINFFLSQTQTSLRTLGMMAIVAGGSNAALLSVVNSAADHIKDGETRIVSVILFLVLISAYIYAQRYVLVTTSAEVERLVHSYREKLITQLKMCELREVEHIGRGRIFSAISTDTQVISQSATGLVYGVQAAVLIVCTAIYLASISMTSFIISSVFLSITTRIYIRKMRDVSGLLHEASTEENKLHDLVSGVLDGFKEVKLSSQRAAVVLADVVSISARTAVYRTDAQKSLVINFIFAQAAFMMLLGTLVFLTPMFGDTYSSTVMGSMTTVMFLIGPISGIIGSVPLVAVANAAAENLESLEKLLNASTRERNGDALTFARTVASPALRKIELRRVYFKHDASGGQFSVGPVDVTIGAGETVFITGGNGSGKSTLIKLITGLYPPLSGELLVNDVPVTTETAQAHRDRFCAVFSDFHLFRKLYGIPLPNAQTAAAWLEEMELSGKTEFLSDGYSTIDLSTGQRKRLALLNALLEDKPIIVLDEWAADQDPPFRRKFYDVLLPRWKAEGKTIIAVTHDDRYFHMADRRFHLEEGQLRDLTEMQTNG